MDKMAKSGEGTEIPESVEKEKKEALEGASQLMRRLATELRVLNMRRAK